MVYEIRRPESACSSNNLMQNPNRVQNPKSKIQDPKSKIQNPKSKSKIQNPRSKIQNPKSKIQNPRSKIQNPKSKIQDPKSKIQNPNGPFGFWILEFGFGWPGWGGYYVANALVWMGWPPKFGVDFCSGKQFLMQVQSHVRLHPQIFCGYTTCCMHGVRVGG